MSDTVDTRQLARLLDGMSALDQGHLGVARHRFDAILADAVDRPLLEAGHAWRGLAQISVRRGDVAQAEEQLKQAVRAYRAIARVDSTARVRAAEGEGAALLLGAELLLRRGLTDEGRNVLRRAANVLVRLGENRSAEAWAATGRLALHLERLEDADRAFQGALERYEQVGNVAGHAEVLLEAAAIKRDMGDSVAAARMLDLAAGMARNAGRLSTAARAHLGRAQIADDEETRRDGWERAFHAASSAGDLITTGFALLGLGSNGWRGGEQPLLGGSQLLLDGGHFPGLGLGMLRLAEHALRAEQAEDALVACEGGWRVYRGLDPVEGLSRVLRVAIKAFAELRLPRSTLLTAYARAALVGETTPHAIEVRDHYARLAPEELRAKLDAMNVQQLMGASRRAIQRRIMPVLRQHGLSAKSFGTAQGALDVMGVMLGISPRNAVRLLVPAPHTEVPEDLAEPELPDRHDLSFGRHKTLRVNVVAAAVDSPMLDRLSSPVYDPDGRLAALASQALVFVEPATADEQPSASMLPVVEVEEDDDVITLFPEDSGAIDWMKFSGTEATWRRGKIVQHHPTPTALVEDDEDDEGPLSDEMPTGTFPAVPDLVPKTPPAPVPEPEEDDADALPVDELPPLELELDEYEDTDPGIKGS